SRSPAGPGALRAAAVPRPVLADGDVRSPPGVEGDGRVHSVRQLPPRPPGGDAPARHAARGAAAPVDAAASPRPGIPDAPPALPGNADCVPSAPAPGRLPADRPPIQEQRPMPRTPLALPALLFLLAGCFGGSPESGPSPESAR